MEIQEARILSGLLEVEEPGQDKVVVCCPLTAGIMTLVWQKDHVPLLLVVDVVEVAWKMVLDPLEVPVVEAP